MTMQFTARHSGHSPSEHARSCASDRRMCRRLVVLTLPAFLVATAVRRVFRTAPAQAGRQLSLYAEARASAYATIPFVFMG